MCCVSSVTTCFMIMIRRNYTSKAAKPPDSSSLFHPHGRSVFLHDTLRYFVGTEFRAAHGTELRFFENLLRQSLVMIFPRPVGIERQFELAVPVKTVPRVAHGVVRLPRARAPPGDIGGVGRDLVGDDSLPDVGGVGQPQMFLGRDVAEHAGPVPASHRGAGAS